MLSHAMYSICSFMSTVETPEYLSVADVARALNSLSGPSTGACGTARFPSFA